MPGAPLVRSIHFETLGCRLNQDETEGAARFFSEAGFICDFSSVSAKTEENRKVILCVVNTCTVTCKAEQKGRRIIRLLLEKFPSSFVIVTGCYAEVMGEEISSINKKSNKKRVFVLPGTKKSLLCDIAREMNGGALDVASKKFSLGRLESFIQSKLSSLKEESIKGSSLNPFSLYTPTFEKHSRASLKIQDGCDNSCSFCRIHFARGKSVSLAPEKVLDRVLEIEKQGFSEVILTGVNLSQYKAKSQDGLSFSFGVLLNFLIEKTFRIKFRVSSFYPQYITEELCKVFKNERVQPFFHLSIQSGSDRILKLMNRPYGFSQVQKAVSLLRSCKDNPFISCDIIAGFPGESEEDFELTKKMCKALNFAWIHAFPFSPRPGTKAFSMKPKIPERIKNERVKWLTEKAISGKISYIRSFEGSIVEAYVEKKRQKLKSGKNVFHAVTENFLHVEFVSESDISAGSTIMVKIGDPLEENISTGKETECKAEYCSNLTVF